MPVTRRIAIGLSFGCALVSATLAAQSYVPHRVFDSGRRAFTDFEAMAANLTRADVVFVGEQHDDPNTHRLELAVLEGLARRGRSVVVSLEMFERDVQEPLDHFLMGHMEEPEFLKAARPWPRYATDYKPLVDFAVTKDWPVIAANVPRAIASEVSKGGLDVLRTKDEASRALFARDLVCPTNDDYFKRFAKAMGSHPTPGAPADEAKRTTERYYFSQCLKDETMAESIAAVHAAAPAATPRPVIVHFNGAFHSDYTQGTAARVKRRLPRARIVVISIQPVGDLDALRPGGEARKVGEYVVYTEERK
jgi:uncharacterized iron-regulated protein